MSYVVVVVAIYTQRYTSIVSTLHLQTPATSRNNNTSQQIIYAQITVKILFSPHLANVFTRSWNK